VVSSSARSLCFIMSVSSLDLIIPTASTVSGS